jgi:hypothetical protein
MSDKITIKRASFTHENPMANLSGSDLLKPKKNKGGEPAEVGEEVVGGLTDSDDDCESIQTLESAEVDLDEIFDGGQEPENHTEEAYEEIKKKELPKPKKKETNWRKVRKQPERYFPSGKKVGRPRKSDEERKADALSAQRQAELLQKRQAYAKLARDARARVRKEQFEKKAREFVEAEERAKREKENASRAEIEKAKQEASKNAKLAEAHYIVERENLKTIKEQVNKIESKIKRDEERKLKKLKEKEERAKKLEEQAKQASEPPPKPKISFGTPPRLTRTLRQEPIYTPTEPTEPPKQPRIRFM